jgi:AcrR family transcriptional regulator
MSQSSKFAAEPGDRQRQIAAAALACFGRSGFHGASMQDICAEAGMSAGALYRYFPSKAAIIVAIVEAEREQHAAMFAPLEGAPDPLAALQQLGEAFLTQQLTRDSGMLTFDVIAEAGRNPDVLAAVEKTSSFVRETLCRALKRGQALGVVDSDLDIEAAGQLILALGDGLCVQIGGLHGLPPERIIAAMKLLLARFCRPIGAEIRA